MFVCILQVSITYKEIQDLCFVHRIHHMKKKSYELRGRMEFTKEQRSAFKKQFKYICNVSQCCTKDTKFEIDYTKRLSGGGTNEKSNL